MRDSTNTMRRGFTVIELLVVVAVIGLLTTLILPAVQSAREASRRLSCVNNLKQFGLALASYASVHECLPPGQQGNSRLSLHYSLLPYLDQNSLYELITDMNNSGGFESSDSAQTILSTSLAVMLCPSDRQPNHIGGFTNYAANVGYEPQAFGYNGAFGPWTNPAMITPGFVKAPAVIRYADFVDGTSGTSAMAEVLLGTMDTTVNDQKRTLFATAINRDQPAQFDDFMKECSSLGTNQPIGFNVRGAVWMFSNPRTNFYNHANRPNTRSCINGSNAFYGALSASSLHGNSVNCLFVDGHVAAIAHGISLENWRAIGTRNGSELVGAF